MTSNTKELPPDEQTLGRGEATTDLMKQALAEAKELARLELALAKSEATGELRALKVSATAFGVGAAAAILGLATLLVALVLAAGGAAAALVVGGILLAIAAVAVVIGVSKLPAKPLPQTTKRVEKDVQDMKERIA